MTLKQYIEKRDFSQTPEPFTPPRKAGSFRFVVQKHRASHLHYDLRLEHQGVLKSWAIPKGISTNPADKHLAIQVEDHPYEYKDFEGLIPKGNYGAGSVIIWDEGTYTLAGPGSDDPAAADKQMEQALTKGHLSILFYGTKLRGEFSLVRLKNGENQWLIIKKADAFSSLEGTAGERSVRTGKTLEDIESEKTVSLDPPLALAPSDIDFKGALKRQLPSFVEPMLATLTDEPFDRTGWIYEVKWDGYRSIAIVKDGVAKLFSRAGKVYTMKFPAVEQALKGLPFNAIFDGEITVLDKEGRSDFQLLQDYLMSRKGQLVYYVFDCLYAGSYDLRALPLERRKKILEKILPVSDTVRISGHIETNGIEFYHAVEKNGVEGVVAKNLFSTYRSGVRSREWLKIKAQHRQEAIVCGFTQGRASRKFFGALVLGVYRDGILTFAGHVGGGFDEKGLKKMFEKLQPLKTDVSPFASKPKTNMPVTWVRPELVVEVKFREWTKDGVMRQPVILGMSEDKDPSTVVREEAQNGGVEKELTHPKIRLSNLYKIFWPAERFTKKDLIRYYWRMSDWILPYLKDRPQALNRHPDGITGESFFQKDMGSTAPAWATTVKIREDSGDQNTYLLCQDEDTLIYMANLGCIEINVWNSVVSRLDKPDYIVLDFDPVDVPFSSVVEAVLATKEVLDEINASAFCKTSGSKGMHIYIPVQPLYDYEQAKNFAHLINMVVKRRLPHTVSLERMPSKRVGKVYLDYLQNRYGATMAAPYSLRPRDGAPVSTPLDWNEVNSRLDPCDFTIRTVIKRVEKKGDLWKDLFTHRLDLAATLDKLQKLLK
ncbi:MAG: DNA ligase D [Endomicrobiales bacterium]|jgi:bifunctional non-homologous end joining protein LigD